MGLWLRLNTERSLKRAFYIALVSFVGNLKWDQEAIIYLVSQNYLNQTFQSFHPCLVFNDVKSILKSQQDFNKINQQTSKFLDLFPSLLSFPFVSLILLSEPKNEEGLDMTMIIKLKVKSQNFLNNVMNNGSPQFYRIFRLF